MSLDPFTRDLGADVITFVCAYALESADWVAAFLRSAGIEPTPEKPIVLPRTFLLNLAAALRLIHWELLGLQVHLEAGLPRAEEAFLGVLNSLSGEPRGEGIELATAVLVLHIRQFAWDARSEWHASVALGSLDGDEALDALAEFLWARRHVPLAH